jgi:hypothetical protein
MAPLAYVTHRTPHRLRIKIPSRRGDSVYFSRLQSFFMQQKNVERAEANPLTGSLLLVSREGLANPSAVIGTDEWFELRENGSAPQLVTQRMMSSFRAVDRQVEQFSGGELDIASIALIGLVIAGIYQVSVGNFAAPAWYTAFWYATSIAVKSDKPSKPNGLM